MIIDDLYTYVNATIIKSKKCGYDDIANRLDDALHLGSSGIEILGAIRNVFLEENDKICKLIGKDQAREVTGFIESCYGEK